MKKESVIRRVPGFLLRLLLALLGLALLVPVVVTPLDLRSQTLFGAVSLGLCVLIGRGKSRQVTLFLIVLSLVASTRYIHWRVSTTLNSTWSLDLVIGFILLAAELYAFVMLLLGYMQTVWPLERRPIPLPEKLEDWPTVDVYVPTYNEPLDVVRTTVLAARAIDWPADKLNVFILDDGRRDAFRAFAAQAGVGYIVRPDNKHAKAGNLNHAMTKTRGEFIAIFDCDHVPTRSFLQVTMGWMIRQPRLALVQTPHHFYSPDPFEKNLRTFRKVPNEGELFYGLIQKGNDLWNATFFCGSCAVIRRKALAEVGGIAVETVTEDAHTALKMQRRGWDTAYLDIPQAAGLATESLSAHVGQRIRWARGMAQIFRIDNPFWGRGLSLAQRLCYSASMLHFFAGLPRLVFLTAPLSYLLFGLHVFNALPLVALSYAVPHLLQTNLTNSRIQGRHRHSLWSHVYETCLAYYTGIVTTRALFNPRAGSFNVTAKGGRIDESYFEKQIARPYLLLIALNVVGIVAGVVRLFLFPGERDYALINLVWTAYNLVILMATLAVAWEQRQLRSSPRINVRLPAMLRLADGSTARCQTVDLASGGGRVKLAGEASFQPGQELWLSIFSTGDEHTIPARVVGTNGTDLRLRFLPLSVEEESALVQAVFSRADAWVNWAQGRPADRPLAALAVVGAYGVKGCVEIVQGVRRMARRARGAASGSGSSTGGSGVAVPGGAS